MKKCRGVYALRIAVRITILALLLVGGASAATVAVNASGGGDYSRIQDSINNARAGDTILVYSGIYHENVNITKQLTLRGIGNPVVDARGRGSAITLVVDRITLEGFSVSGGRYDSPEAGIKVTSINNILSGNNASNNKGDGIYLSSSSDNILTGNNAANNNPVGIDLYDSRNNTMNGNNALNNRIYGIILFSSIENILNNNNISNNKNGIHILVSSSNKIHNNIFNNTNNVRFYESNYNKWNTTQQLGTNIIGGPDYGGNFWANPNGTGFSQTCSDVNCDGICEKRYILDENNIDYLPLSMNFTKDKILQKA